MTENFSKPIQKTDDSAKQLIIEALEGQETGGFDLDSVYNIQGIYYVLEFLKCDTIRPFNSHPRRYWFKNKQKFLSLWEITTKLGGRLYLVNYEDSREQFKVIQVLDLDESGIKEEIVNLWDFAQFKVWFKALNNHSIDKQNVIKIAESVSPEQNPTHYCIIDSIPENAKFTSYLPLYSIRAAAGYFGDGEMVENEGWMKAEGIGRLNRDMFVVRVVGHSMEPRINDGDYCVFQSNPAGSRQGMIVLAQHRGYFDEDNAGAYSVKEYHSTKSFDEFGNWQHETIELRPFNPDYKPIILTPEDIDDFRIVGGFVAILHPESVEEEVANNTIVTAPSKHIGYCIHCGKEIEYTFGEEKPRYYCKDCWREWYHNGSNTKQKENYCHRCGKPHPSSVEKPLCWPNCWHEVTK